jgi:hypothetical protein
MRKTTLEQQSDRLARRRAELGDRLPTIPANPGGRRTESKLALFDRLDQVAAEAVRPPKFMRNR